jgi:hypothetical protein
MEQAKPRHKGTILGRQEIITNKHKGFLSTTGSPYNIRLCLQKQLIRKKKSIV